MEDFSIALDGCIGSYGVLVIGHLRFNPFFGETEKAPPRGNPITCTSTFIKGREKDGSDFFLICDPSLREKPEDSYYELNRRTGFRPSDVTHCYITHSHYDHQAGVNYYPNAKWCAHPEVAAILKSSEHIDGTRIIGVEGEFLPGITDVSLPGHTLSLHGLAFMDGAYKVLIASDSVMTSGHFIAETGMFEEDADMARRTLRRVKRDFDLIVPGHDNAIINIKPGK
ncbi:MAG: MBL fold metallo-hydrolase [Clostridiales bacterium]|jgi:glyoxylase-like metal-dependent hydrolase (beta-lactamase superfamily II)|nr:MBL fold metallo-hydrolase [Clostridiales bacterium]